MPLHHFEFPMSQKEWDNPNCSLSIKPTDPIRRGDRIHVTDERTRQEYWGTVADVLAHPWWGGDWVLIRILDPEVNVLTQFGLTNERGQTFVFWIGDTRKLPVGLHISLFDSFSDWQITSRWTSLTPKNVPEVARIGFVKEIFKCVKV
jgi:hypothetical protein